jgi:hypothetical protein
MRLEPGEKEKLTYPFLVRMGGPGAYQVSAKVRADGGLADNKVVQTNVLGIADLDMTIEESRRVLDVNDSTTFSIRIKNVGTKDATNLLLRGRHSDNLKITQTAGTDIPAEYSKTEPGAFTFPAIERLAKGQTLNLYIKVQALKAGQAKCHIYLLHQEVEQPLEDLAQLRITQGHGQ